MALGKGDSAWDESRSARTEGVEEQAGRCHLVVINSQLIAVGSNYFAIKYLESAYFTRQCLVRSCAAHLS